MESRSHRLGNSRCLPALSYTKVSRFEPVAVIARFTFRTLHVLDCLDGQILKSEQAFGKFINNAEEYESIEKMAKSPTMSRFEWCMCIVKIFLHCCTNFCFKMPHRYIVVFRVPVHSYIGQRISNLNTNLLRTSLSRQFCNLLHASRLAVT